MPYHLISRVIPQNDIAPQLAQYAVQKRCEANNK
jgi:hypothetical protein